MEKKAWMSFDLRFTIYDVRFTMYDLRCTIYDLRFTTDDLRLTIDEMTNDSGMESRRNGSEINLAGDWNSDLC